jgi:molybdopterin synthase sulfur carrier subunit
MSVRVKLLASLADRFGAHEVAIDHAPAMTVQQAWERATDGAPWQTNTLAAVNFEYAAPQAVVSDGDEVAFFPPVTGG